MTLARHIEGEGAIGDCCSVAPPLAPGWVTAGFGPELGDGRVWAGARLPGADRVGPVRFVIRSQRG